MLKLDTAVVFVDTETTHLDTCKARAWEVALIRRDPLKREQRAHFMIAGIGLEDADPVSLEVGGFEQRYYPGRPGAGWVTEDHAAQIIASWTAPYLGQPAVLVGSNPAYDAEVLAAVLRRHGLEPAWYHHTFDLHTATVFHLAGDYERAVGPTDRAYDLSEALGADRPADDDRHTAMGDAQWAARWWDALIEDVEVGP
ncbi:exonuclease domain-containing protein [Brachybacterium kimchii]|uniref:Exonuclease domain-containing protein n=1 Tax=Brachybacterium kimchii TaxID=2942909 RepID=A0ABY4NA59_9MICO|nr:exonuclease domain-containing protein [Brachybacterium kimchii]UQN30682.1 exonuclease domain-containing protein [Brachybacterium kimchii]